jgi:hypothetical protein
VNYYGLNIGSHPVSSHTASASEFAAPHSDPVRTAQAPPAERPVLTADEYELVSLLEENVASGVPPKTASLRYLSSRNKSHAAKVI